LHFKEIKDFVVNMFYDQRAEEIIVNNVKNSIFKMNANIFKDFNSYQGSGILFRCRRCLLCKKFLDGFLYDLYEYHEPEDPDQYKGIIYD
jgi:hypothetical protein